MPFIFLKRGKVIPFAEDGRLRALILCEGKDDARILEALIDKLKMQSTGTTAITDCGGIRAVPELARRMAAVARVSKALKKMAVMVDANDQTSAQRIQAFANSLKGHGMKIKEIERITDSLHIVKTENIDVPIKVAGVTNLPFSKHTIEDHTVQLLKLEGKVKNKELGKVKTAKELIESREEITDTIKEAHTQKVENAFKNILELLRMTAS